MENFFNISSFITAAVLTMIGLIVVRFMSTGDAGPDAGSYIDKMGRKGWAWHIAVTLLAIVTLAGMHSQPPATAAELSEVLNSFGETLVYLTGLLIAGNGVEWATKMFGKNKIKSALLIAALFSGIMAPGFAAANEDTEKTFWMPSKWDQGYHWKEIKKQQVEYQAAKAKAYATHNGEDYDEAERLCIFPMQKAWLLNNRAYHYIRDNEETGYTQEGLRLAEGWLQAAFQYCWQEPERVKGPTGMNALRIKIESNLMFVRDRLGKA